MLDIIEKQNQQWNYLGDPTYRSSKRVNTQQTLSCKVKFSGFDLGEISLCGPAAWWQRGRKPDIPYGHHKRQWNCLRQCLGRASTAWTHASNIFPWTPFAPCTELHTCSFFPCSKKESLRCGIESNSKLEQRASESILEPQLKFNWQQLAYQEREQDGVCMARYCSRKCRVEKWKAIKDAFTDYKNSFRSCIWQMLLG
jgi:hypothetical protein